MSDYEPEPGDDVIDRAIFDAVDEARESDLGTTKYRCGCRYDGEKFHTCQYHIDNPNMASIGMSLLHAKDSDFSKANSRIVELEREVDKWKHEFDSCQTSIKSLTTERDDFQKLAKHYDSILKDAAKLLAPEQTGRTAGLVVIEDLPKVLEENERLEAERDAFSEQVGKLIQSCYYRTQAGRVHWKQGERFGTSTAKDTDPKAFEEAMQAIRFNAGIEEIVPPSPKEGA